SKEPMFPHVQPVLTNEIRSKGKSHWGGLGHNTSARPSIVNRHHATHERLRGHELELTCCGQTTLVQRGSMTGDPGMDEESVVVDQLEPVERDGEQAAAQQHAAWCGVLELLDASPQVACDGVAVGPGEVRARRRHHILR